MAGAGRGMFAGHEVRWQGCDTRDGRWEFVYRMTVRRPDGAVAEAEMAFDHFDACAFSCFPDDPAWFLAGEETRASVLAEALPGLRSVLAPRPRSGASWP